MASVGSAGCERERVAALPKRPLLGPRSAGLRVVGSVALVGLAIALAACGSAGDQATGPDPGATVDRAAPGTTAKVPPTPACQAISAMRLAQFVVQAPKAKANDTDRANGHKYIQETMAKVIATAPELRPAAERLLVHLEANLDSQTPPPPAAGQPDSKQQADDLIGQYEKTKCGAVAPPPKGGVTGTTRRPGEPEPLPWERTYVDPTPFSNLAQGDTMRTGCYAQLQRGMRENKSTGPKIAVIGDSAINLAVPAGLDDPLYHWAFATHCGETFATALKVGRVDDALATNPDALVLSLGTNNTTRDWMVRPDLIETAFKDLDTLLNATDKAKCRVIVDLPELDHPELGAEGGGADSVEQAKLRIGLIKRVNAALHAAASRPGVHLVEINKKIEAAPRKYIWDEVHPTRAGINLMLNAIIEAAQPCFGLPAPSNVQAVVDGTNGAVTWSAPAGHTDTTYQVETSDGQKVDADQPQMAFRDVAPDGQPVKFRVRARTAATVSEWTDWVEPTYTSNPVDVVIRGSLVVLLLAAIGAGIVLWRRRKHDPPEPPLEPDSSQFLQAPS